MNFFLSLSYTRIKRENEHECYFVWTLTKIKNLKQVFVCFLIQQPILIFI